MLLKNLAPLLLLSVFFMCSCQSTHQLYSPQKKYSPEQLTQDFDIAWNTYKKNHPSYDLFTPADSLNALFEKVRASIKDSLTEPEFRLRLSYATSAIRCGHTAILPSKAHTRYVTRTKSPQFPFSAKVWGTDSMVVVQNLLKDSSKIKRGTIVQSIDGVPVGTFIRQMKEYIPTDGYSDGFKELQISSGFGARFKWMYGLKDSFNVGYLNEYGETLYTNLPLYKPGITDSGVIKDSNQPKTVKNPKKTKEEPGSFKIDSGRNLAVLEINSFSQASVRTLIKKSFKRIKKANIGHVAIDLRQNGGGLVENSTLLTMYVTEKLKWRVADSISAKDLKLAYPRHTQNAWIYRYFRWAMAKKQPDGRYHMQSMEKQQNGKKNKWHYDGKVYVLTGGLTFSASTLFLANIKDQPNVTIIGEETGGGARGNSAVFVPNLTLPNTGVRARLPLFRMVTDVNIPQNGRGILPHIEVKPDSESIRLGRDKKMEKVYELLGGK